MISKRIEGETICIGRSQGYNGLSIRAEMINCAVNGPHTPAMVTSWEPTPAEIEAIVAGAPILLSVLGTSHPPVILTIGKLPESLDASNHDSDLRSGNAS